MRLIVLFFFAFCIRVPCLAQLETYTAFTVNDGLPSNNIYRCMEDGKGFLWTGTDAGIARFDGKYFQVFTTLQGLPDNDVLSIAKEKNGRIWVNCFQQSPAYFDEKLNRFINAKNDSKLAKASGTGGMYLYALENGGVIYYNKDGSYIFRDNQLIEYTSDRHNNTFLLKENNDGSQLRFGSRVFDPVKKLYQSKIFQTKGEKYIDSIVIMNSSTIDPTSQAIDEGNFYLFNGPKNKCFIYSGIGTNPLRFKLDSITISEPFYNYAFTGTSLYMVTHSGKIYVYNKQDLQEQYIISGNYIPNSFYNDRNGNIWISTLDKGLVVYKKKVPDHIAIPAGFTRTNFLSIARKQDGTFLAGNYYGEVIELNKKKFSIHSISENGLTRQRKIIQAGKNIFTFSDEGINVNYTKKPRFQGLKMNYSAKAAIVYNDSIILAGFHAGLLKLNSNSQTVTRLSATSKRVISLVKANNGMVYFGSIDGLYKYNYPENTVLPLAKNNPLFGERISALCTTPDNLLWVATTGNGLLAVKDDKVLFTITTRDGIMNTYFRSLTAGRPGQVWLGTDAGISVIHYTLQGNKPSTSIQNITVNDGLTSNEINEMLFHNDTIYAATADGISVIPAAISIPTFNIPVQVISLSVNQRDTVITDKYALGYTQQNIFIRFSGIELSGHFKNIRYTLNDTKKWTNLQENTLNLRLNSGDHILKVRAVDVNGNVSNKILAIQFNIATPFWKSLWFWLLIALTLQLLTIYLVNRRQKKRKEAKLAKEIAGVQTAALEQQAFTSLLNPHFMFNALNSIQHYINVQDRQNANRYLTDFASLIRKSFEAAQQSFIPLEQELENIKIYLRLEQMRFANRFTYHIAIHKNLDTDDWMVPTMMLQPLLENAVLHGIMRSTIVGELAIDLKEQDKNLLITITDNGIGISNSRVLQETSQHKSRGMELIVKRMAALSHFVKQPIFLTMAPAFDNDKNPGNKITLFIPADLHRCWLKAQRQ